MPSFFTTQFDALRSLWDSFGRTQRVLFTTLVAVGIVGILGLAFWINRPDYRILYSNLGAEDTNRVVKILQTDNVPYQLAENGTTILVPVDQLYDLRIKIAGEGNLVGQGIGFEIFDEVKVGQTDFVQRINYQRALQGELARTISEFPHVESARVHLSVPERSLFIEEQQLPSASVVLKLSAVGRTLENREVQSIVNMLTMAVEGLEKERVSISDSAGNSLYFPDDSSLAGQSDAQREHQQRVERGIERRITELLTPVLGSNTVIAKVNAELDYSQRTIRRELYDPESAVVRSEQSSEETNIGSANLEGGSPDANFRGDGLTGSLSTQEGARETRTTNYEINKEEQNIISQVGEISRLTVAVVVDGTYTTDPATEEMVFTPRSEEEMDRIQALVASAVGFNGARGDSVEVSCIPFEQRPLTEEISAADLLGQYVDKLGKPLLNALLVFLFIMLVVRPIILAIIRPKVEGGEIIEGLEGLPSAEEQFALYEAQEEAARQAEAAAKAVVETPFLVDEEDFEEFHIEDVKVHTLQIAEHNMEQTMLVLRGWMKNEKAAAAARA